MENKILKQPNRDLLDRLCLEIESAWGDNRDDTIVDKLAAEYPECAEALYDFFALLIESELEPDLKKEDLKKSVARTKAWLEQEGYRQACEISRRERLEATPTSLPIKANQTAGDENAAREPPVARPLLGFLSERTGEKPTAIAAKMKVHYPFLLLLQRHPQNVPQRARNELASRAELVGVSKNEVLRTFEHPFQSAIAASRNSPYSTDAPSYIEMVRRSGMSQTEQMYWLSLTDEDSPDEIA